jgi:hypothetical protein
MSGKAAVRSLSVRPTAPYIALIKPLPSKLDMLVAMVAIKIGALRKVDERLHGGLARLVRSVRKSESFDGISMWEDTRPSKYFPRVSQLTGDG